MNTKEPWKIFLAVVFVVVFYSAVSEGWKDRVKLQDVSVLTLRQGHMTNGRRSAPVPQMTCVGGSAGCSAFVPKVVQCYNRGSDGYDVQWECKTDMDNAYRFGEIAVNCEGYDYPEDPYILKGSCGLEYTIDHVGGNSGNSYHGSSHHHGNHHGNYGYKQHRNRGFPFSISTLIMWCIIAFIVYYIYSTCSTNQHLTDSTQNASQQSTYAAPPPPGFRPEYTQDQRHYTTNTDSSSSSSNGLGGFWSGFGAGGLAGYLFGSSRGNGRSGYYHHDPYYSSGYNRGYGNSWFGGGNSWFGGSRDNTGWFSNYGSSGSTFGSTHRRSSPSSSSSGSRTASGFGGTKRR